MSKAAGLEHGYRRLLAWYPLSFRREQEEEMLGVLMAGARPGQRRPGLIETADLLRGGLAIRLRAARPGREDRRWADALAVFSVLAPVFLLVASILEVAVPYHLPPGLQLPELRASGHSDMGGLWLLNVPLFDLAVCLQVIAAAAALLGRRRLMLTAVTASIVYWINYGADSVPDALRLLAIGACILGAAAALASPGPRRGRQLLDWRHWAVLLPFAAFVQVSTSMLDARSGMVPFLPSRAPDISGYLVLSAALAALTVFPVVVLRLNRYLLLLLAAMLYPYAVQVAVSGVFSRYGSGTDLLVLFTPGYMALTFAPPLALACGIVLAGRRRRRPIVVMPSGREA